MDLIETTPKMELVIQDIEHLVEALRDYHALYSPLFQRREQREAAHTSLQGRLAELPRKSIEPLVLALAGVHPHAVRAMQAFISAGTWKVWPQSLGTLDTPVTGAYILDGPALPPRRGGWERRGCGTGNEVSIVVVSASKTWEILPALVACLLAVAAVGCLVHTDGLDAAQTAHQGHRRPSSSSSAPITLDLHCLIAILPAAVGLVWLCLSVLSLAVLWSHPVVPAFPPFIPPKALARA